MSTKSFLTNPADYKVIDMTNSPLIPPPRLTVDMLIEQLQTLRDALNCGGVAVAVCVLGKDGFTTVNVSLAYHENLALEKTREIIIPLIAIRDPE